MPKYVSFYSAKLDKTRAMARIGEWVVKGALINSKLIPTYHTSQSLHQSGQCGLCLESFIKHKKKVPPVKQIGVKRESVLIRNRGIAY